MSHGENAERRGRPGKEYCSRRMWGMPVWCASNKRRTHRLERHRDSRVIGLDLAEHAENSHDLAVDWSWHEVMSQEGDGLDYWGQ